MRDRQTPEVFKMFIKETQSLTNKGLRGMVSPHVSSQGTETM